MTSIHVKYHQTPVGELILGSYDQHLCLADYRLRTKRDTIDRRLQGGLKADYKACDDEVLSLAATQIDDYLLGRRQGFDLPLLTVGTEFQKLVWTALMSVGFGETCTYLDLAERLGNPKAVRAVANANGANAISLIIPCHRIVGSNGTLVGYAGGLDAKRRLLALEGVAINHGVIQ